MTNTLSKLEIIYPSSDGQPMAESTEHYQWIVTIEGGLEALFKDNNNVFIAGDLLWYPVEGQSEIRRAPDVMVVFDIEKRLYANYKIWEGQQTPAIIFEVTSAGTKETDWNFKKTLYEQLGVTEYWLFDPYGEWITEQLQGYRVNEDGVYKPIRDNCSEVLQLKLQAEAYLIGFYRLDNGEKLLTPEELYSANLAANQRVEQETQRAEQEKARADRLAEKLRQLGVNLDDES